MKECTILIMVSHWYSTWSFWTTLVRTEHFMVMVAMMSNILLNTGRPWTAEQPVVWLYRHSRVVFRWVLFTLYNERYQCNIERQCKFLFTCTWQCSIDNFNIMSSFTYLFIMTKAMRVALSAHKIHVIFNMWATFYFWRQYLHNYIIWQTVAQYRFLISSFSSTTLHIKYTW